MGPTPRPRRALHLVDREKRGAQRHPVVPAHCLSLPAPKGSSPIRTRRSRCAEFFAESPTSTRISRSAGDVVRAGAGSVQARSVSAKPCDFRCYKVCYARRAWSLRAPRRPTPPARVASSSERPLRESAPARSSAGAQAPPRSARWPEPPWESRRHLRRLSTLPGRDLVSAGSVTSPRPAPNVLVPALGGAAAIAAALPDLPRRGLAARRLAARRHALAREPGIRVPPPPPAHARETSPPPESPEWG